MTTKSNLVYKFIYLALIFTIMPTISASSSAIRTDTTNKVVAAASHIVVVAPIARPEASEEETKTAPAVISDIDSDIGIPPSFDAPFGSYPNLLNVTNNERESFSPVVIFPKRFSGNSNMTVKDHRQSSGELASREAIEEKRTQKRKLHWERLWKFPYRALSLLVQRLEGAGVGFFGASEQEEDKESSSSWAIGKYDENRDGGMYKSDLFDDLGNTIDGYGGRRTVHLGMDLGGPVGTPVHAFCDGIVHSVGYNPDLGDYGYVIILEHFWGGDESGNTTEGKVGVTRNSKRCWALYGHLDESTLTAEDPNTDGDDDEICAGSSTIDNVWKKILPWQRRNVLLKPGDFVRKGQVIGCMGDIDENGGWIKPHLHFQISTKPPDQPHDMPGASSVGDRIEALKQYTDPRYVLGPLH